MNAVFVNHYLGSFIGKNKRAVKLLEIVMAVSDPTKITVAKQIILFVRVEGTRNDLFQDWTTVPISEQPNDGFTISLLVDKATKFLVLADNRGCHCFVNLVFLLVSRELRGVPKSIEGNFRNMAEWSVPGIVKQRRQRNNAKLISSNAQPFSHEAGDMGYSQRVIEPRMQCTWIDEIGQCQLSNAAQSLQYLGAHERTKFVRQESEIVDGLTDSHKCHLRTANCIFVQYSCVRQVARSLNHPEIAVSKVRK